jgi:hypothetical protein
MCHVTSFRVAFVPTQNLCSLARTQNSLYIICTFVSTVLVTLIGAVSNADSESPLSPVQLLWVNLIMDTLAGSASALVSFICVFFCVAP